MQAETPHTSLRALQRAAQFVYVQEMKLARPLQWLHGIHGQLGEKQSLESALLFPQPTSQGFQAIFQGEMTGWLMIEGLQGPGCVAVSPHCNPIYFTGNSLKWQRKTEVKFGRDFFPPAML